MMSKRQAGKDLTLMSVMAQFSTEEADIRYFEAIRWPKGLYCPHCGNADAKRHYSITANRATKIRPGLHQCADCRLSFTVRLGTVMEDSHVPLNKWLIGFYMMCASKTRVSAVQLQRQLEIGSYSAARFLRHRIRFALMDLFPKSKLDRTIAADETCLDGRIHGRGRAYRGNKTPLVSWVERDGRVRPHIVDVVTGKAITRLLQASASDTACLNTDESPLYNAAGRHFAAHDLLNHSDEEHGRFDHETGRLAATNTVE